MGGRDSGASGLAGSKSLANESPWIHSMAIQGPSLSSPESWRATTFSCRIDDRTSSSRCHCAKASSLLGRGRLRASWMPVSSSRMWSIVLNPLEAIRWINWKRAVMERPQHKTGPVEAGPG